MLLNFSFDFGIIEMEVLIILFLLLFLFFLLFLIRINDSKRYLWLIFLFTLLYDLLVFGIASFLDQRILVDFWLLFCILNYRLRHIISAIFFLLMLNFLLFNLNLLRFFSICLRLGNTNNLSIIA